MDRREREKKRRKERRECRLLVKVLTGEETKV